MTIAFDFDSPLPVAVIGAGPVGLAAAAQLLAQGEDPVIFEAGRSAGANVLAWGHVRLFSPWRYMIDSAARELLTAAGDWVEPDGDVYPTGRELVEGYLAPLAPVPAIRSRLRLNARVVQVTRDGFDKMKTEGREDAPFVLTVQRPDGSEERRLRQGGDRCLRHYRDPESAGRRRRAGHRRAKAGRSHLLRHPRRPRGASRALRRPACPRRRQRSLRLQCPARSRRPGGETSGTTITWAIRRPSDRLGNLFGGGINDALPARGALGERVQRPSQTSGCTW